MATPIIWSSVAVAMQSALATAVVITGITKASPGVVSYTDAGGSDPTNGNYVVMVNIQGMNQVNNRVFRVANVSAGSDTFELEGENTSSYDTFTSGSFQVITFGTTLATARGLTASGGDYDYIDTTTIHDQVRTQIPGLPAPLAYSLENIWDVADGGLVAMNTAAKLKAQRAFRFTFSSGQIMVFNGYVGASLAPVGNAQDLVTTPATITMFGLPTYYSS